ncbi:MAG: DUF5801 repeats-in-toxin domain-containing protein [Pseudomonadota bacterium]
MNDLVRIAQAITPATSAANGGGENAALPLELSQPAAGLSVTATRVPGQLVDFRQILNEDISFIRIGGDLQMIFANGGSVIVQDFFAGDGADQVAVVFDGETISIDQFVSVANLQVADEIQTAAGETSNLSTALGGPQGSGQDFQDANIGELGPGLDVFDLLTGEGPGSREGSIDEFSDGEVDTAPTIVSAADAGAIDEGNLADGNEAGQGPLVATGNLGINFGENAGQSPTLTFDTNGAGVPLDSAGNAFGLTADGVALTYSIVSNADGGQSLTAVKEGTGEVVFTVTLDVIPNAFAGGASGAEYIFSLEGNLDHLGATFDESLPVSFSITATDSDGDSVGSSFVVNVADDDVEVGASEASAVDEDGLTDGNVDTGYDGDLSGSAITSSGTLGISWGSDNANPTSGGGTGDRSVSFSGTQSGLSGLTSNGNSVSVSILADGTLVGYTGDTEPTSSTDSSVVFFASLSDADSGSYQFTLAGNLDHSQAGTEDDIVLSIAFTATDGDGDTASSTFEVTVDDDAPVIVETSSAVVDEDDLATTQGDLADGNDDDQAGDNITVSDGILDTDGDATTVAGDLAIEWGADASNSVVDGGASSGNGDRAVTFATTAIATLEALDLTSQGEALSYELSNSDSVLTATSADGRIVFTVTLSDENSGSFVLDLNDVLDHPEANTEDNLALTFDFTATDSDGDSASSSFQVTVDDDSPVLTGDVGFSQVDEEGLSGGNVGESYPDNEGDYATGGARDDATTSGRSLNISWGADDANSTVDGGASTGNGDRSVEFASADVLVSRGTNELDALTSRGETVEFRLEDNGATLVGYVASSTFNGGSERVVFEVTLSDQDNGSYDFEILDVLDHQGAGKEDNIRLTFDFTATDSDGDSVDGTFAVRIDDDAPVVDEVVTATVDEDDIVTPLSEGNGPFDGDADGSLTGPFDALFGPAISSGSIANTVNFGADGAAQTGGFAFATDAATTMEALGLSSNGETLSFEVISVGGISLLVGFVDDGDGSFDLALDRPVLGLALSEDGDYAVLLNDQLDHVAGDGENTELVSATGPLAQIDFGAVIEATDGDGDMIGLSGQFLVDVTDDVPEPQVWVDDYVRIDETYGDHSDNVFNPNTGQYNPRVVSLFNNVSVTGSDVDLVGPIYARYDVIDYSLNGGADDQATRTLELRIDDPDSGLFTTENEAITLSMEGDLVVGRIDTGEAVFAIHIDLRGRVSIVQYQSLKHDDTSTSDEHIDLAGKISAVLTVTDADGDAVSTDVTIGADVTFDDDGPDAFRRGSNVRLDEASDLYKSISGQLQFDGGADGATVTDVRIASNAGYVTSIDREESGSSRRGDLTSDGMPIVWAASTDSAGVIAVVGVLEGSGATAFLMIIQPDGSYTYQQFVSFDHPDEGQTGADDRLAIRMDFTVTDGDGDTDTASAFITIADSGPEVGAPEIETVFEDGSKVLSDISLEIDWGADDGNATSGAGAGDRSVSFAETSSAVANVSFRDTNGDLTELRSNGELVQFTFIGGVLVGFTGAIEPTSTTDTAVVLTVALSDAAAGTYSFELSQPIDHTAPVGSDQYIDLTFSFNATDSDQDVSEDSSFTVRVDAAGTISSIDYSVLSTGVFVNLSDSEQTEQGQTVSANTATDRSDVSTPVVGEDDASGLIDAIGGSGDDILVGDDSSNQLLGGSGEDLLAGGLGADTLTGGEDADTFVLDSLAEADIITDYTFDDGDKIDLGDLLDAAFKSGEQTEDLVRATENVDGSVKVEVDMDGTAAGHDWQEAATLEDHASMGDTIRVVMDNDGTEVNVSVA